MIGFNGCKRDKDNDLNPTPAASNGKRSIKGAAQKGPFLNGSSITVYELNDSYGQTGQSFVTEIEDNSGSFELNNISLTTNYVQVRANGFYFNEVCGNGSVAPITLNCITNVADSSSVHINLLTHLEKARVEYLLSEGLDFEAAKHEAQQNVLSIFNMADNGISNSEYLDISRDGEGNAILLAISSVLQGYRTEAELSTLLAVIGNDIRTDGTLNDSSTMASLLEHALLLDTIAIRSNVTNFYSGLGMTYSIPHFETYLNQFISSSAFPHSGSVYSYPVNGAYGPNILDLNQTTYNIGGALNASMTAQAKKCSFLKIKMHLISGSIWAYVSNTSTNLVIPNYDQVNNEQTFSVIDPGSPFDLYLNFSNGANGGTYLIDYFEKDDSIPTFSKTITIN